MSLYKLSMDLEIDAQSAEEAQSIAISFVRDIYNLLPKRYPVITGWWLARKA